uniref:Transcobalamin-like C-terminal domain-containing protein n=1 Tax=Monopterus albus TaxID=43700 RepID=A0A3Q3K7C2_MONAL|nr:gastric intrinsic factor-like [Monopterus albus]
MAMMPVLLSAAILLLLLPGTLTGSGTLSPLDVVVENSLTDAPLLNYTTHVAYRGILLGALKRLVDSNASFNFTYTENLNYGPYLESVNDVAGNDEEHTYWQLLVQSADGKITAPDVGIGCYIPSANEKIILKFTKW